MLGHGPLRLDTPPPVRRVCVVVEPECPTCHRRTAATHAQRHRRTTHAGGRTAAAAVAPPAAVKTGTPPPTRRTTGPRVQVCAACHYALFTIPGILCHARTHHAVGTRLAVPVAGGRPQSVLARPMGHRCPLCPAAFNEPEGLKRRQAAERGIGHPSDFGIWSRLWCEETPRHPLVCAGVAALRTNCALRPGSVVGAGPGVVLARFLVAMIQCRSRQSSRVAREAAVGACGPAPVADTAGAPLAACFPDACQGDAGHRHRGDEAAEVAPPRLRVAQLRR
ncbi:hypothetical protein ABB37_07038 [Leptomonas pyrrhocoris]|uniref:Uncharacterized protein n=1 Tax=Leptomonas pyrrhocoris TaxID=157538 RepID=A0A0M9FX29_LEPPY|nr:hypothetical protein ABB37_07038 [Leptomonas pyrrhocoris]KPA77717.1 hypothetical protein ABB37_07038 [Leptomonas pyrrhocoris]|eukprot:XP_015656156.1 hypothetical protein ABB37_07038 [Leptomonas pyrrhocoris]